MITKSKSNKLHHPKKQKRQKSNQVIDVGKPQVPLDKTKPKKSLEKLEYWEDAS